MKFITADVNWSDALGAWQKTCEWPVINGEVNPWSKTTAKYTRGWKKHEGGWLRQRGECWVRLHPHNDKFFVSCGEGQRVWLLVCARTTVGPVVLLFPHAEPARVIAANLAECLWNEKGKALPPLVNGLSWGELA